MRKRFALPKLLYQLRDLFGVLFSMHVLEKLVDLLINWRLEHERGQQVSQTLAFSHVLGHLDIQLIKANCCVMKEFHEQFDVFDQHTE